MDENLLLTAETLVLSRDLQKSRVPDGGFVLKNIPTQTYLRVSEMQWHILQMFVTPQTVPRCLESSIQHRLCIPLKEFYELIIKAQRACVLCSAKAVPKTRKAFQWSLTLPVLPVFVAGIFSVMTAAVLLMIFSPTIVVEEWWRWLVGWVLWGVALSLGNAVAASVLVKQEGEIYRPRFLWQRPVPHFSVDLSDSCMQPTRVRETLELAKYIPLSLITAGALYWGGGIALPLLAGFLFGLRPLGKGGPAQVFALMRRRAQLDTDQDFQFSLNRRPSVYWSAWWQSIDWRLIGIELAYAVLWTVSLTCATITVLGLSPKAVLGDWSYWQLCFPWLGGGLLLMFIYVLARQLYDVAREKFKQLQRQARLAWMRWRAEVHFPDTEDALMRLVASNALLGQLNLYDQACIARALRPAQFKARTRVVAFDQKPDKVGLIFSGRAVVCDHLKSGRRIPLVKLAEGDLFGAHAMVDSTHPSLEVRSSSPLAVMMMPAQVFQAVVIAKLGVELAYDLTHKHAFLSQLSLCEHWYGHALGRFSKLSKVVDCKEGERVVMEGSEARAFFIVYEGKAVVTRRGQKVGIMKPGDFFGEIGLLQNSTAVAEVTALTDMRCLQIGKAEFLRFVAHNHHVALQLERVSSERLGRPIFPMFRHSFEER